MKRNTPARMRRAAALAAFAALLVPGALLADYAKEFNVKFSGYAGSTTLTNFPALVRLSQARNAFDYASCQVADGGDTRFFDADGNLLPSEVDTWNPSGESLVWVSVPELKPKADGYTTITVKYGNAAAPEVTSTDVWTNGYVGVWHMNAAEGTFTQRDSTTTGKNLAPNASYRTGILCGVEGAVGKAAELGRDGATTGAFYVSDNGGVLDGFPAMTLEVWTYQTNYPGANSFLFNKLVPSPANLCYNFYQRKDTSGRIAAYFYKEGSGNGDIWQGNSIDGAQLNEWTHQVARWNGASGRRTGFMNGVSVYDFTGDAAKGVGKHIESGSALYIGNNLADHWGNSIFPGKIDEVRISSVARSDDWVVATHDTIANDDFAEAIVPNDWTKYAYKFSVAFPGVEEGATLDDFPVLVKVSEAGITGFRYADCAKEGGADLRFTDANGAVLPCEVEVWDTNGESLVWVKVPTLAKGTRITAYYGWNLAPSVDSTDVWDSHFRGVWHMGAAAGTLSQKDATANGKTVTGSSSSAVQSGVSGKVGLAAQCGLASTGGYGVADSGHFDGFGAITVEAWTFRAEGSDVPTANAVIVEKSRYTGTWLYGWSMYEGKGSEKIGFWFYSDANSGGKWLTAPATAPTQGEWHYHARRYNGTTGVNSRTLDDATTTTAETAPATPDTMQTVSNGILCIGNRSTTSNGTTPFVGCIDEVRISDVARSDAWVKATYDTIADNATFTRYGRAGDNIAATVVIFR